VTDGTSDRRPRPRGEHAEDAWHLLRNGGSYRDLGHDYFDRLDRDRLVRYHTRRLADLGVVLLAPAPAPTTA
jgi:hypothetical protein